MKYSSVLFFLTVLFACQSEPVAPDVSDIELDLTVVRFEQELFEIDTVDRVKQIEKLIEKHPEFAEVFVYQIIADPNFGNDGIKSTSVFIRDSFIRALNDTCQLVYGDFSPYELDFKRALQYFKFYFPEKPTPVLYTCVSGFEVGSFTIGDEILGVGLDFYLGADYPNYHPDLFPAYIKSFMSSEFLVSKTIQALLANCVGETPGNRLLDFMIRNGIELYLKQKVLPYKPDEIIFEYTPEQMQWLRNNEAQIWAHLVQEDLLYSVNFRSFQKIVNPSPNISSMPPEAPGRLGNWIGARIVANYMQRNPDTDLHELLSIKDADKILAGSNYKPRQ
ncbi:MAG: hypothetical protein HKN76_02180 [Saprospiraceae bacterium]|nr:hypothetical protein [Saprospiraceae bacterium]